MANSDRDALGDIVRAKRIEHGLSLRTLAKQLSVTPSYMSDIENDRRVPAEDVLRQIGATLGLDFDLLMAQAGRLGEQAVRYIRRTPSAGILFRRLAENGTSPEVIDKLLKHLSKSDKEQNK